MNEWVRAFPANRFHSNDESVEKSLACCVVLERTSARTMYSMKYACNVHMQYIRRTGCSVCRYSTLGALRALSAARIHSSGSEGVHSVVVHVGHGKFQQSGDHGVRAILEGGSGFPAFCSEHYVPRWAARTYVCSCTSYVTSYVGPLSGVCEDQSSGARQV